MLRRRFERLARRAAEPGLTLAWALAECDRGAEALTVVDEAIAARPNDGALLHEGAVQVAVQGCGERARELLRRAEGRAPRAAWLRSVARVRHFAGEETNDTWSEIVALEPLAADAHAALASRIAAREGAEAALAHLAKAVERFPHHRDLIRLRLEWLRRGDPAAARRAIEAFLEAEPSDAWGWRELAFTLLAMGERIEASKAAARAASIAPHELPQHMLHAALANREGDATRAAAALREAVRRDADCAPAIHDLVNGAEEAARVLDEVRALSVSGAGMRAWADAARPHLEPERMLAMARALHEARPDAWAAAVILVRELLYAARLDEARAIITTAIEKFPLVAAVHLEAADVMRASGDPAGELACLERAMSSGGDDLVTELRPAARGDPPSDGQEGRGDRPGRAGGATRSIVARGVAGAGPDDRSRLHAGEGTRRRARAALVRPRSFRDCMYSA
jgi:tetratricopeptide (TPR) repeat protein